MNVNQIQDLVKLLKVYGDINIGFNSGK